VKSLVRQAAIITIALDLAFGATPAVLSATSPAIGTSFNARGKITLHRGEPCTSQIVFDFHPLNSNAMVWMAAGAHDSAKLTEAAGAHRRVRVTGVWRHGQRPGCAYVEVNKLVAERSWLESLFKP
jgi:hypothetical protein